MTWNAYENTNPEWEEIISDYTDMLDNGITPREDAWDFAARHGIDQQYMFDVLQQLDNGDACHDNNAWLPTSGWCDDDDLP